LQTPAVSRQRGSRRSSHFHAELCHGVRLDPCAHARLPGCSDTRAIPRPTRRDRPSRSEAMMPPRSNVLALAGCVLLACTGCLPSRPGPSRVPAREATPASLAGCYSLYTADGRSIGGRFYNASPRVRLDTASAGRSFVPEPTHRLVRLDEAGRLMDAVEREGMSPSWTHKQGGLLQLSFSDGFSGASVTLATAGDTLRGTIEENWDMGPSTTSFGGAYAVRIPCRAS
jgi:hypothetical protein